MNNNVVVGEEHKRKVKVNLEPQNSSSPFNSLTIKGKEFLFIYSSKNEFQVLLVSCKTKIIGLSFYYFQNFPYLLFVKLEWFPFPMEILTEMGM